MSDFASDIIRAVEDAICHGYRVERASMNLIGFMELHQYFTKFHVEGGPTTTLPMPQIGKRCSQIHGVPLWYDQDLNAEEGPAGRVVSHDAA